MDTGTSGEEPKSCDELYNINLMPSELFLKFRKEIEGFRVGLNMEFYNVPLNEYHAKLVLKPLSYDRKWKFIYERCAPSFQEDPSYKLSKSPGSGIRHQLGCALAWICGLGGEQTMSFQKSLGHLQASLDRVEAILTHKPHNNLLKGQECSKNSDTVLYDASERLEV